MTYQVMGMHLKDELGYFADQNGDEVLVQSVDTMVKKLHAEYPDVPHFLFGHSMGSIIVRLYLERNDDFAGCASLWCTKLSTSSCLW